jgi:hypothetical protein
MEKIENDFKEIEEKDQKETLERDKLLDKVDRQELGFTQEVTPSADKNTALMKSKLEALKLIIFCKNFGIHDSECFNALRIINNNDFNNIKHFFKNFVIHDSECVNALRIVNNNDFNNKEHFFA